MSASTSADLTESLAQCEQVLDYRFTNPALLRAALTHASGANDRLASNERMEFLGDAILGAVVCDLLFRRFPEFQEGELTRIKSHVVSRRTCTKLSRKLGIDVFLIVGKGMWAQSQTPQSVLADVFESLVGAIYLDGGIEAARRFIVRHVESEVDQAAAALGTLNHKSQLQQVAQHLFGETPTYLLLDEKGPDHSKCFKIAARIGSQSYPPAWGPTKKDAQQRAALNALSQIEGSPIPYPGD